MKVIELNVSVTESNDRDADAIRKEMKEKGALLINLMSSPGSGKTTLLSRTITDLMDQLSIGVMEADIASDVDAVKIESLGAASDFGHSEVRLQHFRKHHGKQGKREKVPPGIYLEGIPVCPLRGQYSLTGRSGNSGFRR